MIRAFEPFQEVARHACCAIIHGGIGTLADGILAGCPLLVEPYGGDQYLNARQVPRLKIGAAADRKQLTEGGLVRLLTERVLLPDVRQRAEALAVEVRKEDGLTRACELIEMRARNAACSADWAALIESSYGAVAQQRGRALIHSSSRQRFEDSEGASKLFPEKDRGQAI